MTDKIEAGQLEEYAKSRGFLIDITKYANEKSKCLFTCLRCNNQFIKTVSAFKRSKKCKYCPALVPIWITNAVPTLEKLGFQIISHGYSGKIVYVRCRKNQSVYNISPRSLSKLLGVPINELYGIEVLDRKSSYRKDRDKFTGLCSCGKPIKGNWRSLTDGTFKPCHL